jgi:cell volume regulation protein A
VPVVLATIPLAADVDGATRLFDLVFVLVVAFTLVTGPTLPWVARLLGVARVSDPRGLEVEAAPLDRVAADLLQVGISRSSKMHGVEVGELRLPVGASVAMVVRGGQTLVPERRTVLHHGDELLVVTPRRLRAVTEERLRQVSAGGRLARWLGTRPADG